MAHQPAGDPAVLARDQVGGGQHALGAPGQVLEVADRRGDEIEARGEFTVGFASSRVRRAGDVPLGLEIALDYPTR